ncbi:unnamed protein product, partial [Staurois parvus]
LSPDKTYRVETLCTCSVWCVFLEKFFFFFLSGSGETRYSECRVWGDQI